MQHVLLCAALIGVAVFVAGCAERTPGGDGGPRAKRAEVGVTELVIVDAPAVTPRCECSRIGKPVSVDGDLSEWEAVPVIVLDKPEFARKESAAWAGPQDVSGSMRMGWDSDFLYLAFDVTDDVFNQPFSGGEIWAGDCVQFAFDTLEERTKNRFAPHELEYTVALTEDGPVLWRVGLTAPMKTAKVAAVRKPGTGGVRYEIGIPWSEMSPLAPGLMTTFGFSFTLNDSDGGRGLKSWLQWTPGICDRKDPSSFGQAAFAYTPPPAGAGELYVSTHVPDEPDVESLKFRVFRFAPGAETLTIKLALTSDGKAVASATCDVAVAPGANRREVAWTISGLADGSYQGTISVAPPSGPVVERSFAHERVMTAPIRAAAEAVKRKVARAAEAHADAYRANAANIDYRVQAIDVRLASPPTVKTWQRLAELVAETGEIAEALARGADWFATARGRFTRAYLAPEDDMVQPFRISVPPDYDGSKPYPLVVWLHGYGGDTMTWEGWFTRHEAGAPGEVRPGYLVVNPYGRGNTGWRGWGRNDAFHVVEEMKKRYNVDPDRISVTGFSMGGGGTWYIASRYPDRWSAASPQAGSLGIDAWKRYANEDGASADWKKRLSMADSDVFVMENFLQLPVVAWHGIGDGAVSVETTETAFGRLRQLGYEAVFLEGVRQGHDIPAAMRNAAQDWMLTFRRRTAPERVTYRTFDLRYNRAYWVEIDELVEDYRLSEVKASWFKPERIDLETRNVSRLTLSLPDERLKDARSLDVVVNGAKLAVSPIPEKRVLHLASADGGASWQVAAVPYREGFIKKHGASGPMGEALADRFLVVYGTSGDDNATAVNREEAEAFAKGLKGVTMGRVWGAFRVMPDREVSEADARGANLVLFGGPESNACARKIAASLPVRVEAGRLVFRGKPCASPLAAVKFVYPNPDAPGRYVLFYCGAKPEAIRRIPRTPGGPGGPDWLLVDSPGTEAPAPGAVDGGFFDRDWK